MCVFMLFYYFFCVCIFFCFKEARISFIGCAFFCKDYRYPVKEREELKLNEMCCCWSNEELTT